MTGAPKLIRPDENASAAPSAKLILPINCVLLDASNNTDPLVATVAPASTIKSPRLALVFSRATVVALPDDTRINAPSPSTLSATLPMVKFLLLPALPLPVKLDPASSLIVSVAAKITSGPAKLALPLNRTSAETTFTLLLLRVPPSNRLAALNFSSVASSIAK